jgi:site-specific recombinase XerD
MTAAETTLQLATRKKERRLAVAGLDHFPALIARAGEKAAYRFVEFFTANIRNRNTRIAYGHAAAQFFEWCEKHGLELHQLNSLAIAAYIEQHSAAAPTVKQHLAALRMLFDWLVLGQIIPTNPAQSVRGPRHVVKKGKTPVLTPEETRQLLDSIDAGIVIGLRDRALIAFMTYTFARVGAVLQMRVEDYYIQGRRSWVQLREKGGKEHHVPCHHRLDEYLHQYISQAGIEGDRKGYLFRSALNKNGTALTDQPLHQQDVHAMIRRRAAAAGILTAKIGCHTLRATGITAYMKNGGRLEVAQQIANHESPRTTKLYDRTEDEISLDEVERIVI